MGDKWIQTEKVLSDHRVREGYLSGSEKAVGRHCKTYDELVGVSTMLRKRIDRYVDRVVGYLPILERRKARRVITGAIYARLDDLTSGARPTAHDLRMVLREMGDPESLADAYYDDFHRSLLPNIDLRKSLHRFFTVLMVVALAFVVIGLIELVAGSANFMVFVLGGIMGIMVVLYQMFVQPYVDGLTPSREY